MIINRRPPATVRLGLSTRPRRVAELGIASWARHADWVMLAAVAGLLVYGLDVLRTITVAPQDAPKYDKQVLFALVGVPLMLAASIVDPERYRRAKTWLFGGLVASLLAVIAIGTSVNGSQRWISLPGLLLQPSEFGKVVIVLAAAAFLADRVQRTGDASLTLGALAYAAVPGALVFLQPDLGTALVFGASAIGVLWLFGTRWTHFAALGAGLVALLVVVLVVAPAAGHPVLKGYQKDRLTVFLDPSSLKREAAVADSRGDSVAADQARRGLYQYEQALTAVGHGGLRGQGVGEDASQVTGQFLPEHYTDFFFASVAEQRGFLGCAVLLGLFALLLWRALMAATIASTQFQSLVAGGIAVTLLWQVFLNVGMNVGIMPITGVPLPLLSYGGSSLWTTLISVGILEAIVIRGRLAGPEARTRELTSVRS